MIILSVNAQCEDTLPMEDSDYDGYLEVSNCCQLQAISSNLNGNYELTEDIDCSDTINWNSGSGFQPLKVFTGKINGDYYIISDLFIDRSADNHVALFGETNNGAEIRNLFLEDVVIRGRQRVGGLIGYARSTEVDSVSVSGSVAGTSIEVGGLIGSVSNHCEISNALSTADVQGSSFHIGGLLGYVMNAKVSDSYASGIVGGGRKVGGLIGTILQSGISTRLSRSFAAGDVSGSADVGSLVGVNGGYDFGFPASITGCYFYDHAGNPAVCIVKGFENAECTAIDDESHFYHMDNSPMDSWDADKWFENPGKLVQLRGRCTDSDGDGYSVEGGGCGEIDCDDSDAGVNPGAAELCNGIDDDCDVSTIDGSGEQWFGQATSCGIGECSAEGILDCINGVQVDTCTPGQPGPELCDTKDNDCDPSTPDGSGEQWFGQVTSCGVGLCASEGMLGCSAGQQQDSCIPGTPQQEICDGLDNDCDGQIDEVCGAEQKETALSILSSIDPISDAESRCTYRHKNDKRCSSCKCSKYRSKCSCPQNKDLQKAIDEIEESLGNRHPEGDKHIIWEDAVHINCRYGHKVFDHEKKAVLYLERYLRYADDEIETAKIEQVISMLVVADRTLADIAVNEMPEGLLKEKALQYMEKGDQAAKNKDKIQEYRKAWKLANHHVCKHDMCKYYCGCNNKYRCDNRGCHENADFGRGNKDKDDGEKNNKGKNSLDDECDYGCSECEHNKKYASCMAGSNTLTGSAVFIANEEEIGTMLIIGIFILLLISTIVVIRVKSKRLKSGERGEDFV